MEKLIPLFTVLVSWLLPGLVCVYLCIRDLRRDGRSPKKEIGLLLFLVALGPIVPATIIFAWLQYQEVAYRARRKCRKCKYHEELDNGPYCYRYKKLVNKRGRCDSIKSWVHKRMWDLLKNSNGDLPDV